MISHPSQSHGAAERLRRAMRSATQAPSGDALSAWAPGSIVVRAHQSSGIIELKDRASGRILCEFASPVVTWSGPAAVNTLLAMLMRYPIPVLLREATPFPQATCTLKEVV